MESVGVGAGAAAPVCVGCDCCAPAGSEVGTDAGSDIAGEVVAGCVAGEVVAGAVAGAVVAGCVAGAVVGGCVVFVFTGTVIVSFCLQMIQIRSLMPSETSGVGSTIQTQPP